MKKNKSSQPKEIYLNRVKCNCVAQKHELINNCLSCGKVVCALQGQGPCLYCGHTVIRPDGKYIGNDQSLFPSLSKQQLTKVSKQRSKATLHKDTLVARDKSTAQNQSIIDEAVDYYQVMENSWLDQQSRNFAVDKVLQKAKFIDNQQFKQKIVFDPLSGKFVTEQFSYDEQKFKAEGKTFMQVQQKKEYQQKMSRVSKKYDNRLMANEKVKQIVTELKKNSITENPNKANHKKQTRNKVVDLVLEDQVQFEIQVQQKGQVSQNDQKQNKSVEQSSYLQEQSSIQL